MRGCPVTPSHRTTLPSAQGKSGASASWSISAQASGLRIKTPASRPKTQDPSLKPQDPSLKPQASRPKPQDSRPKPQDSLLPAAITLASCASQ